MQYVRLEDLRRDLNAQFREQHPTVNSDISLSKIRRVKELLLTIGMELVGFARRILIE